MKIQFGTDGWRAVIADGFTFHNLERAIQAAADFWNTQPHPAADRRVIVGYDRRFLSAQFAQSTAEVLAGNQIEAVLTDRPTATPAVSFAIKQHKAAGGIMITASHNPARFNGLKIKAHYGGPADAALCGAIEARIDQNPVRTATNSELLRLEDVRPAHYAAVKRLVDFPLIAQSKQRFAHDAMFGAGAGAFEDLLRGTSCQVTTLRGAHDPNFGGINPEPLPQNYAESSAYLRKHPHDICLVTDGDGDRVGGMDGHGRPLTTHQIICLLLHHFIVNRQERGRVIKALTTSTMVDKMCEHYGLPLVETPVGFKYLCAEILKGGALLGVEESGSIGFPELMPERDGIAAGMMLLELLAVERKPVGRLLSDLERDFGAHHYARLDIHYAMEKREPLMEYCKSNPPARLMRSPLSDMKSFDGVKMIARDRSWLMLRGSGTEPVLRIYAEAPTATGAQKLVQHGLRMARQKLD